MLVSFVLLYLAVTIGIGLWAATRVHNAKDYVVAGRSLPLGMTTATVFATWFGAETVLSVSATFAKDGLGGIVADPFGASFCLLFVALFFARAFYRMDLLTIGDFYRKRYSRPVELITSLAITASYLGWTSAQLTALGLVFSVLSGGAISLNTGIIIGGVIVLGYTIWGGMWSVAMTDLFQSIVILVGLCAIAWLVSDMAGGTGKVIAAAVDAGRFEFWPKGGVKEWLWFVAAWMTLAVGSIPQQDVFQRVTSAKNEQTAVRATLLGGAIYFCFAFVPIFIAYSALVIDPSMSQLFAAEDGREIQRILPDLILERTPLWAQVLFFGALLSAILSTASGALIAPTALATENIVRPLLPRMGDRQFLLLLRLVLVTFSLAALLFALNSTSTMYEMVQNAYKVTLVSCLVPLAAGVFWKRANVAGATLSVVLGLGAWGVAEVVAPEATLPPQLVGLAASLFGMVMGVYAGRVPATHAHHG
ncbi:MAG: sodium:solute symporter family protein [Betaproteobacteria bacterium]|nr:sodium:solute symporter family protein [Betaproteobacteria bacterium]MDH5220047.1 sodium:solute symporter family protein [Betaproteobacteria bacterium]MDH5349371.1 sodium:solute symporter family protein [Betaproteobacteria bacterium]